MHDFEIYLINLDGSEDRLEKAASSLAAQDAKFTRISAFDGRKLDVDAYADYDAKATGAYMGRRINGGEIGCYVSHVRVIQAFLETDADFALVLEDDMQPSGNAIAQVGAFVAHQRKLGTPDWHLAHLGHHGLKITTQTGQFTSHGVDHNIHRAHYFPMMTNAILWTRAGAQAFLDVAYPIIAPIDNRFRKWLTASDMGIAVQPPIFGTTGAESEIDKSNIGNRRATEGRLRTYGLRKQRRMMGDKIMALKHKFNRRIKRSVK